MAGFLDKKTRVIDMILTDYGRELYSKGELEFTYYTFSDDEVDYDPYISTSGTLSEVQLTASKIDAIESTLVREAVYGYPKVSDFEARDEMNVRNVLFTMPQGQRVFPEMKIVPDVTGSDLNMKQQLLQDLYVTVDQDENTIDQIGPIERGYVKFDSTKVSFEIKMDDFFDQISLDGNLVRVYMSSSHGYVELHHKKDLENVLSFMGDLRLFKDENVLKITNSENNSMKSLEESVGFNRNK